MCWEKELREEITCAVSQHCPQQRSWGGSHSAGAAHRAAAAPPPAAPSTATAQLLLGTRGLLLHQGRGRLGKTGSQECLKGEVVSHKVALNLWTSRTFI